MDFFCFTPYIKVIFKKIKTLALWEVARSMPTSSTKKKKKKKLEIKLTKEKKDLQTKNYKFLLKEIEEDTEKWIGRIHIVKMSIPLKESYRFNVLSISFKDFLLLLKWKKEKSILKFMWKRLKLDHYLILNTKINSKWI